MMRSLNRLFLASAVLLTFVAPSTAQGGTTVTYCVENALNGLRSVWLSADGMDQRWRALDGASFVERPDGTATYLGAIENIADPRKRFSVRMDYGQRINPGQVGYPPTGSPYLNAFIRANLVTAGGTIDPSTWHYYQTMTGTFTGRRLYEGAVLNVSRRGEAFQVGNGANGLDLAFGGSGWFHVVVVSNPTTPGVSLPTSFDRGDTNTTFGNNCVCTSSRQAGTRAYGAGSPGCSGVVPTITIAEDPLTHTSPAISISNSGQSTLTCAMIWGIAPANTFSSFLNGTLLVASPFASVDQVTVPPSGYTFNCTIPDDGCQAQSTFYLQVICLDVCPGVPTSFALSDGLEITIGDL